MEGLRLGVVWTEQTRHFALPVSTGSVSHPINKQFMIAESDSEIPEVEQLAQKHESWNKTARADPEDDRTAVGLTENGPELPADRSPETVLHRPETNSHPETRTIMGFNRSSVRSHKIEHVVWGILIATAFALVCWSFVWGAGWK